MSYRFIREHNSGTYGVVWEGFQEKLNRRVAIKLIKVEFSQVASARTHALALARLNHPNIVTVYDLATVSPPDQSGTREAIIMEWVDGRNLGELCSSNEVRVNDLLRIAKSIILGVRYMHSNGLAHGDLHAGNVIVGKEIVKIIDVTAADSRSISRFSTMPFDLQVQSDISAVSWHVRFMVASCIDDLTRFQAVLLKLPKVADLDELSNILDEIESSGGSTIAPVPKTNILLEDGLGEIDIIVLKSLGNQLMDRDDYEEPISKEILQTVLITEGVPEEELPDSIEILTVNGYLSHKTPAYSDHVKITQSGFESYLRVFYEKLNDDWLSVGNAVLKDGLRQDIDIHTATNVRLSVVRFILDHFRSLLFCSVVRTNKGVTISEVKAKMRREFRKD